MIKNISKQALTAAIAATLGMGATAVLAQTAPTGNTDNSGYTIDARNAVVKSGTGLCWRTGYWTPALANLECDPDLVPKAAPVAAPAPAPKGAVVAPAPAPVAQKVSLAADALFDFDKADLRAEGKTKLDELAGKLSAINLEVIIAVGHTDRLGKEAYNQKLSEKRAAAVKTYLVSKGVEANRVYTEGKGMKMPALDKDKKQITADCKGKPSSKNKKLVACLQPDRRVDIEVVGTQAAK